MEFLNRATNFYQSKKQITPVLPGKKNRYSIENRTSSEMSVEQIEKKLIELYRASQEELGENLPLLALQKKELELAIALHDKKIDRALLLEPPFRIALSVYLGISPQDLSEQHWVDAEVSTEDWKRILHFSESNDFRILLLQGSLSKEEIDRAR